MKTLLKVLDEFAQKYMELYEKRNTSEKKWFSGGWRRELLDELASLKFNCCKANDLLKEVIKGELQLKRNVISIYASLSHVGAIGVSSGVLYTILEVGISWDYILDLPVLSGSALKGATRSFALSLCAKLDRTEAMPKCFNSIVRLFGWVEKPSESEIKELETIGIEKKYIKNIIENKVPGQGLITFYDAYPVAYDSQCECSLLEPWVMTPHYGSEVEDEYDVSPIPILHVVLKKGTMFSFIISYDDSAENHLKELKNAVENELSVQIPNSHVLLAHLVASALEQGIGARTSKGYTSFKVKKIARYRGV